MLRPSGGFQAAGWEAVTRALRGRKCTMSSRVAGVHREDREGEEEIGGSTRR